MAKLLVRDLRKRFGPVTALRGVNFDTSTGEVLALLGPNGAGKTTILRCVAGVLLPDSGDRVLVDGDDQWHDLRGLVAYMPETPDLYGSLTVAEHIRFVALAYRVPDWRARADALLDRFQLSDKVDALPSQLSQGMGRKVALVMALLHGARVVLMDEPFNGLDPRAVRQLRETIAELARSGVAVVLSTHRLEETQLLADRLAVTYGGRIVASGTLDELRATAGTGADADLESVFIALTEDET